MRAGEAKRRKGVAHTIEIDAPVKAVWQLVSDLNGWSDWNPLYPRAAGRADPGQTFAFTVSLRGMKPQDDTAQILEVQPERLLTYEIVSMKGLLRAYRYIELVPTDDYRCIVVNGESMTGAVGMLIGKLVGERVREGLQAMNEALKSRSERRPAFE